MGVLRGDRRRAESVQPQDNLHPHTPTRPAQPSAPRKQSHKAYALSRPEASSASQLREISVIRAILVEAQPARCVCCGPAPPTYRRRCCCYILRSFTAPASNLPPNTHRHSASSHGHVVLPRLLPPPCLCPAIDAYCTPRQCHSTCSITVSAVVLSSSHLFASPPRRSCDESSPTIVHGRPRLLHERSPWSCRSGQKTSGPNEWRNVARG